MQISKLTRLLTWIVLCSVPLAAQMPPISSAVTYVPQPFDIVEYNATLTIIDATTAQLQGVCNVNTHWLSSINNPRLPIHLRGLTIDSVLDENGHRCTVTAEGLPEQDTFHYRIEIATTVAANDTTATTIYYSGRATNEGGASPWGGVHYEDSVLYALGVGFNNPEVSATSYWMPCYDHPSDKALLDLSILLPKNTEGAQLDPPPTAVSVGIRTSVDQVGGNTAYHWRQTQPSATYLYTFAVGRFLELALTSSAEVPSVAYSLERDTANSTITYACVGQMTSLFEDLFGPYPFEKVGYVNTSKGAMEHQTLISMSLSVINRADSVSTTVAHELAHQWFGDYVTPINFAHAWLTESFATYAEGAWLEKKLGWGTYLANLANGARAYTDRIAVKEGVFPLFNFSRTPPSSNYPETIYRKGACVLSMARTLCGTTAFYNVLRTYLQAHAYGNAVTEDVVAAFAPALGTRNTAFFNEWVFGKGWPMLSITYKKNGTSWKVVIEQVQQQQHPDWPLFTTLPLNVTYTDVTDGRRVDTVIVMEDVRLELDVKSASGFGINEGSLARSLLQIVNTTSIVEQDRGSVALTIRPQPAVSLAVLEWTLPEAARLIVVDASGRTVWQHQAEAGTDSTNIQTSGWAAGLFQVQVLIGNTPLESIPLVVVR